MCSCSCRRGRNKNPFPFQLPFICQFYILLKLFPFELKSLSLDSMQKINFDFLGLERRGTGGCKAGSGEDSTIFKLE